MAESASPPTTRRTGLLIWMIISQVLMLGTLVIWLVLATLSVMAFDSGVSNEAWFLVILVWSYPLIPSALIIGGWIAYAKRRTILAVILSGLSFAPPILCFVIFLIVDLAWFAQFRGLTPYTP